MVDSRMLMFRYLLALRRLLIVLLSTAIPAGPCCTLAALFQHNSAAEGTRCGRITQQIAQLPGYAPQLPQGIWNDPRTWSME